MASLSTPPIFQALQSVINLIVYLFQEKKYEACVKRITTNWSATCHVAHVENRNLICSNRYNMLLSSSSSDFNSYRPDGFCCSFCRSGWLSRSPEVATKITFVRAMANIGVPVSKEGDFQRVDAQFRHSISSAPGAQFPPEANRYHLYISYACPWASRCLAVLNLKGLQDAISLSVTNSRMSATKPSVDNHAGWTFPTSDHDAEPGATPDPHNHARTVRELYEIASLTGRYTGRYSVPVLWDTKTSQIVSNESSEIIRMLNGEFNHIAAHPDVDLYPANLRAAIDDVNSWVFTDINNGVYRCGFAVKQEPYEAAFHALFTALEKCEAILGKQRFIAGDELTEADVRLFMTLIRFDAVYVVHFKCNKKFIREYPNLFNYTKDLFQVPGIGATVDMRHIKEHYYGSHPMINPYGIVAVGQEIDYSAPHDRDRFGSKGAPHDGDRFGSKGSA